MKDEELNVRKQEILTESFELVADKLSEYSTNMNFKEFVEAILKISNKNSIEKSFKEGRTQTLEKVKEKIDKIFGVENWEISKFPCSCCLGWRKEVRELISKLEDDEGEGK